MATLSRSQLLTWAKKGLFDPMDMTIEQIDARVAKIRAAYDEARRLSAMANKRARRLESNGLEESPAYQKYIAGKPKFGVRGKNIKEVEEDLVRLRAFINTETSTVRGASRVLKDMAANTGIKYESMKELVKKSANFFTLASKIEQYLRLVNDMGSAIGYQEIWQAINEYTTQAGIELSGEIDDVEGIIENISQAIAEYEAPAPNLGSFYPLESVIKIQ